MTALLNIAYLCYSALIVRATVGVTSIMAASIDMIIVLIVMMIAAAAVIMRMCSMMVAS